MKKVILFLALMSPALAQNNKYTMPNSSGVATSIYSTITPSYVFTFGTTQQQITIHPDGKVTLAEGLNLDEASKLFWKTIQDMGMRLACEEKKSEDGTIGICKPSVDGICK